MSEEAYIPAPAVDALANDVNGISVDATQKPKKEKKKKEKKPKEPKEPSNPSSGDGKKVVLKDTSKMGLAYRKEDDFGMWYSNICTESELISYYNVSGCYILRPWAYAMWEQLQKFFDGEIKKLGVENAYFPLFVTKDALEKEESHIDGFSAEVAWVTKSGTSDLEVPLAIRPTSETVMYPLFADWIQSHRDLPLKLNQWTNVVRWEFKNATPFIRTREFLWQEGHTAHAHKEDADAEVRTILRLYQRVYEDMLAVPVIPGWKSENEKFAGGDYTTTVEAFIPTNGRAIQGATSHHLGLNFGKMFGIEYSTEDKGRAIPFQNSWGFTTRTLGVMIMVHGDNKGLVLPPRVAPKQVMIIPIPNAKMSPDEVDAMMAKCHELESSLNAQGIRTGSDVDRIHTPGFKYNKYEVKGVPVRLELGPRDMTNETVVLARRDLGTKEFVTWAELPVRLPALLEEIHAAMYSRAKAEFDACLKVVTTWKELVAEVLAGNMVLCPWTEEVEEEEWIRNNSKTDAEMGAKSLCIPFEQPPMPEGQITVTSDGTGVVKTAKRWGLFGRSY